MWVDDNCIDHGYMKVSLQKKKKKQVTLAMCPSVENGLERTTVNVLQSELSVKFVQSASFQLATACVMYSISLSKIVNT